MAAKLSKEEWILLALSEKPLDRIRLMKTLFLIPYKLDEKIENYFEFEPYLYGPFSSEVYRVLEQLESEGKISQAPSAVPRRADFYLTAKGQREAEIIASKVDSQDWDVVSKVVAFASSASFNSLLRHVYRLAPDMATASIMRQI